MKRWQGLLLVALLSLTIQSCAGSNSVALPDAETPADAPQSGLTITGTFKVPTGVAASLSPDLISPLASLNTSFKNTAAVDEVGVAGECFAYTAAGVLAGTATADSTGAFSLVLDPAVVPEDSASVDLVVRCATDSEDSTAPTQVVAISGERAAVVAATHEAGTTSSTVAVLIFGRTPAQFTGVALTEVPRRLLEAMRESVAASVANGTISGQRIGGNLNIMLQVVASLIGNPQGLEDLVSSVAAGETVPDAILVTIQNNSEVLSGMDNGDILGSFAVTARYTRTIGPLMNNATIDDEHQSFTLDVLTQQEVASFDAILATETLQSAFASIVGGLTLEGDEDVLADRVAAVLSPGMIVQAQNADGLTIINDLFDRTIESDAGISEEGYADLGFLLSNASDLASLFSGNRMDNFIVLFVGLDGADLIDTDASDGAMTDYSSIFSADNLDNDWAAVDDIESEFQPMTLEINPDSCGTLNGLNWCTYNPGLNCNCDSICEYYGDCCDDYQAVCGDYLEVFSEQASEFLGSSDDGEGDGDSDDGSDSGCMNDECAAAGGVCIDGVCQPVVVVCGDGDCWEQEYMSGSCPQDCGGGNGGGGDGEEGGGDEEDMTDIDGDGLPDSIDNCPDDANADQADSDGDGTGDACAIADSDGEGVVDAVDNCPFVVNLNQFDADDDGMGDACDDDIDGDGDSNDVDGDDDGDGSLDAVDNCPLNANNDQADSDGDGTGDACAIADSDGDGVIDAVDNCPNDANADQADSDGDGTGDACEAIADSDGDGVADAVDNCPNDVNADQADSDGDGTGDTCEDSDGDGTADAIDNCPLVANLNQLDADDDSMGDLCDDDIDGDGDSNDVDGDDDGDGSLDAVDNCPLNANDDQGDSDSDGMGDFCDSDVDGDGVEDVSDNCTGMSNPDQANADGDGAGDPCDAFPNDPTEISDSDGDGLGNYSDNCMFVANADQADTDGDGTGDACE